MGKGTRTCAVNIGAEDDQFRSSQAHYVGFSPQENRSGTAGEVGKGEGSAEESGVAVWEPAAKMRQAFVFHLTTPCHTLPLLRLVLKWQYFDNRQI